MNWYYTKGTNRIGPMSLEQLVAAAQTGALAATDLVWSDGMPSWVSADSVPDLFSIALPHPLLQRVGGSDYLRNFPSVEGRSLIITSGTVLPRRCVKTNVPVMEDDMIRKDLYWCNPLWILTIFIGVFVVLIAYYACRKKCIFTYGLAPEVRKKYRLILTIKAFAAIAFFLAFLFSTTTHSTTAIVTTLCLFFASLIALPFGNSPLTIKTWNDGRFWIKGCSPEFLASLASDYPTAENYPLAT